MLVEAIKLLALLIICVVGLLCCFALIVHIYRVLQDIFKRQI